MIPALGGDLVGLRRLVRALDGIMMTGSPSNVHPSHYGRTATIEAEPFDPARDRTSLELTRLALEEGVPLLAICRGYQEPNVSIGGTLHGRVHAEIGIASYRERVCQNG